MTPLLRTIIIDSDDDARADLQHILARTASVIVGEFRNIPEALHTAPAYRPDVVIVEIPLAEGRNGDGASSSIEHLARVLPDAAILVTGPTQSAHLVIQVMRAGAVDYVARPVKQEDLRAAFEKVARSRPGLAVQQPSGHVISVFSRKGRRGRYHGGHESRRLLGPAIFRTHGLGRSGYAPVQRRNIPKPPLSILGPRCL